MYKITINKVDKKQVAAKEWTKMYDLQGEKEFESNASYREARENQYDYLEVEKTVSEDTKVFEQVVEEVDLSAVIKAINGI